MRNRIATLFVLGLLAGCDSGGGGTTTDMAVANPADMATTPPADMAMMSMADMAMMSMGDMAMASMGDMSMNNAAACMAYCTTITTNCGHSFCGK